MEANQDDATTVNTAVDLEVESIGGTASKVWKIERLLKEGLSDEDTSMSAMCKRMLEKFDKYWSEYSVVLAFGVVLDPRFKFKVLEKLYAKVGTNPTKCQAYIEMLRKKLYKLYDQYVSAIGSSSSQPSSSTIMHSRVESQVAKKYPKRLFNDVLDVSDEIVEPVEISELDRYLEQPCYEMKFYQDLDVLDHWKGCVQGFPILSCMARDLLHRSLHFLLVHVCSQNIEVVCCLKKCKL